MQYVMYPTPSDLVEHPRPPPLSHPTLVAHLFFYRVAGSGGSEGWEGHAGVGRRGEGRVLPVALDVRRQTGKFGRFTVSAAPECMFWSLRRPKQGLLWGADVNSLWSDRNSCVCSCNALRQGTIHSYADIRSRFDG